MKYNLSILTQNARDEIYRASIQLRQAYNIMYAVDKGSQNYDLINSINEAVETYCSVNSYDSSLLLKGVM